MTDRPIDLDSAEIRAIQGGKTQLRRPAGGGVVSPGDRLWVREAWRTPAAWDDRTGVQIARSCVAAGWDRPWCPIQWDADGTRTNWGWWRSADAGRRRPGTTLPRAFSRLTLVVVAVSTQRLQGITDDDARAEGAAMRPRCLGYHSQHDGWSMDWAPAERGEISHRDIALGSPRMAFASAWNARHRATEAWAANPTVEVIIFAVHQRGIDDGGPGDDD